MSVNKQSPVNTRQTPPRVHPLRPQCGHLSTPLGSLGPAGILSRSPQRLRTRASANFVRGIHLQPASGRCAAHPVPEREETRWAPGQQERGTVANREATFLWPNALRVRNNAKRSPWCASQPSPTPQHPFSPLLRLAEHCGKRTIAAAADASETCVLLRLRAGGGEEAQEGTGDQVGYLGQ